MLRKLSLAVALAAACAGRGAANAEDISLFAAEEDAFYASLDAAENTDTFYDLRRCFTRMRFLGISPGLEEQRDKVKSSAGHCQAMVAENNSLADLLLSTGDVKSYKLQMFEEDFAALRSAKSDDYYDLRHCMSRARYYGLARVQSQRVVKLSKRCRGMIKADNKLINRMIRKGAEVSYKLCYSTKPGDQRRNCKE